MTTAARFSAGAPSSVARAKPAQSSALFGLVQGGVLMTFADRTCGITARYVSGKPTLATVQLDTHFVEAGKIGEVLISRPRVVRSTRSLIFITTEVTVDKRVLAMANGVFK